MISQNSPQAKLEFLPCNEPLDALVKCLTPGSEQKPEILIIPTNNGEFAFLESEDEFLMLPTVSVWHGPSEQPPSRGYAMNRIRNLSDKRIISTYGTVLQLSGSKPVSLLPYSCELPRKPTAEDKKFWPHAVTQVFFPALVAVERLPGGSTGSFRNGSSWLAGFDLGWRIRQQQQLPSSFSKDLTETIVPVLLGTVPSN